jgi:hypothetical protein
MIDDDDRPGLLTLASDPVAGLALLDAADDRRWAALLHGLLGMLSAASREVLTEMGQLAVGVAIESIADGQGCDPDPFGDLRIAAALILAHSAARAPGAESGFCEFGASSFNATLDLVAGRCSEVAVAVASVWRSQLPWLFSEDGRQILRRVEW